MGKKHWSDGVSAGDLAAMKGGMSGAAIHALLTPERQASWQQARVAKDLQTGLWFDERLLWRSTNAACGRGDVPFDNEVTTMYRLRPDFERPPAEPQDPGGPFRRVVGGEEVWCCPVAAGYRGSELLFHQPGGRRDFLHAALSLSGFRGVCNTQFGWGSDLDRRWGDLSSAVSASMGGNSRYRIAYVLLAVEDE